MQRIAISSAALLIGSLAFAESGSKKDSSEHEKHFVFRSEGKRLGIEAIPISKEVRRMLGAPEDAGVLVNRVETDTSAAEAGIQAGDVIVEIDGYKIEGVPDIREVLADKKVGDKAQVTVIREKSRKTLTASIKEPPAGHRWGRMFNMDDGVFFNESYGPKFREQLNHLSERIAELEKKLQKLDLK